MITLVQADPTFIYFWILSFKIILYFIFHGFILPFRKIVPQPNIFNTTDITISTVLILEISFRCAAGVINIIVVDDWLSEQTLDIPN